MLIVLSSRTSKSVRHFTTNHDNINLNPFICMYFNRSYLYIVVNCRSKRHNVVGGKNTCFYAVLTHYAVGKRLTLVKNVLDSFPNRLNRRSAPLEQSACTVLIVGGLAKKWSTFCWLLVMCFWARLTTCSKWFFVLVDVATAKLMFRLCVGRKEYLQRCFCSLYWRWLFCLDCSNWYWLATDTASRWNKLNYHIELTDCKL